MNQGNYTVGDLLGQSELKLELLAGGDNALLTPVVGAHTIELEHPAKWLDTGWMMLTMGVRLRNKPQAQRELVADLQKLGASCLGFGVGLAFKSVPPALLDEASIRAFPIILIPEETQFRDIERAVSQSTVGLEPANFRRLSSIQQNLLRAFADPNPLEAVLGRLGQLINSTVAVVSNDGNVTAATGAFPVIEVLEKLGAQAPALLSNIEVSDWHVTVAPVTAADSEPVRWLMVASRRAMVSRELAQAAIQVTTPLVSALLRLNTTGRDQDRADRQSLLDELLDASPEAVDYPQNHAKLSALGVDSADGFRVVVLRERRHPSTMDRGGLIDLEEVMAWIYAGLGSSRYLLSRRENEIVALVDEAALPLVAGESAERWSGLTAGVGRPVSQVVDVAMSHRDGQTVVRYLELHVGDNVMFFDDLDIVTQLMAEVPAGRFVAKANPLVAQLSENPIQLEALRAYFAMNRDIKAAADMIFVHPNTLRYRLERLERIIGRSLRDPAVTASLYCVLTLMAEVTADSSVQRLRDGVASPYLTATAQAYPSGTGMA